MRRFAPEVAPDPATGPRRRLFATPYKWKDPRTIPPREWVYGFHYVRQFVSTTAAPGGVGKSSLALVEAIAIATGRNLLGIQPNERTRVWYWNGEDPQEELDRRVGAVLLHFGMLPEEVEGWLFLDSGHNSPIQIAEQTKDGIKLVQMDLDGVEETIVEYGIGAVILDPFVSIHGVPENDNGAIDKVTKALASVAKRTRSAFELVHHVRKTNGAEVTVEDGRGASALLNTARCARAINQMTQEEADKWGVVNRRIHFRYYDGKANLAPPSEKSTWLKLESVDLGNATNERPSDWLGVATRWEPPQPFDAVTTDHMHEVRRRAAEGQWRSDPQSPDWIGKCVADVIGFDLSEKPTKARVKTIVKTWISNGALETEERKDGKRNLRTFVVPGAFKGGG